MANTYPQILKAGLQASYDALQPKDNAVLYFCTDTGKIYKGATDFTNSVVVASAKPEKPIVGKLYVLADTNTVEAYVGGSWKVISYPMVTSIDENSDDAHVASAKAIYTAIQDAIAEITGGSSIVKDVAVSTTEGKITITKGDNTTADVAVHGVVTTPTWDATARKLTLPIVDGTSVEVNIGKDIFIDPEAENGYHAETNEIWVYLNDGTTEKDPTLIKIPAAGLVDVYTGGATDTASVSVSDTNVITATVKLDPDTKNAITSSSAGIKVDLSAYALTETVNGQISGLQGSIDTLNGDATKDGSVAKTVTTAVSNYDTNTVQPIATRVGTLETTVGNASAGLVKSVADNTSDISTLKTTVGDSTSGLVKGVADNASDISTLKTTVGDSTSGLVKAVADNTANIAALATAATTWGTF